MSSELPAVNRAQNETIQQPEDLPRDLRATEKGPAVGGGECGPSVGFTDAEREAVLMSGIWSQSLEGIEVSYELASQLLDEVLREPLIDIG